MSAFRIPDRSLIALAAMTAGMAAPVLLAQPCQPYWVGGPPGPSNTFAQAVSFDDGTGPALFGLWTLSERPYRWRDGDAQWTPITNGLPQGMALVSLLVLDDGTGPRLFANGNIQLGGPILYATVRWSGTASGWQLPWPATTPDAFYPKVSADLGDGMTLYGLQVVNGTGGVVKRVGDHWQQLGGSPNASFSLVTLTTGSGTSLYIGGGFSMIGGAPVTRFARWTGQQWVQAGDNLSTGLTNGVNFDDGTGPALYGIGGGVFNGQSYFNSLIRFDGQRFSLAGFGDQSAIYAAHTPVLFDDGRGPAIYFGGSFPQFAGVPAHGVVRYDGHTWSTLGEGIHGGEVFGLAPMPTSRGPALFTFGGTSAGAGTINGTAQWVGCPNCYANGDNSTISPRLNVLDFICFLNRFAARDPYANCNVDAAIDINDFVCFMGKFAAGCP